MSEELVERIALRISQTEAWLADYAPLIPSEQKHLDAGTPERAYWHYGYLVALRDIMNAIRT